MSKLEKYYYSIINGLPVEFEKDELIEFLYNERKVIKVTAKVSIQVNEIPVGTDFYWAECSRMIPPHIATFLPRNFY